ncbi:alpha/beta hydrolase [Citricoccus sp. CH26A]|uniref:alpha/beta hydrolase n=1 Tax=Citricoccus TaxID=169133 RepID=UPI0002F70887|nr:alpha/beta hydrolase [Citricoccus sp. CH26A]
MDVPADALGPPAGSPGSSTPADPGSPSRRRRSPRRWTPSWTPSGVLMAVIALAVVIAVAVPALFAQAGPPSSRVLPRGAEAMLGLEYAVLPGNAGTLDLFVPARGRGPYPVVLWSQGSGWTSDRGNLGGEPVAEQLARRGYAVALFSVRSSEQAVFPAQVHDAKAAVRFIRAHAEEFGLDPDRVVAAGNSSGGWIATMLGVTSGEPALEGELGVTGVSSRVHAVVNFFAPTDFLSITSQMLPGACDRFNESYGVTHCHDDLQAFESRLIGASTLRHPDLAIAASPLAYIDAGDPPTLIAHGTDDWVVPYQQSSLLFAALDAAGVPTAYYEVADVGHDFRFAASGSVLDTEVESAHLDPAPPPGQQLTWDVITDFLDRQTGGPHRPR